MQLVQNEQKLKQAIDTALQQLRESARSRLPSTGEFAPLSAHFSCAALVRGAGEVELRIGSVSGSAGTKDRFVEVRVFTPSAGSHSSSWVFYGKSDALQQELQKEALMTGKIRAAILEAAESILRNEFA